ncbi:hypothetical protein [Synechococcus sp. RS9916]|uniref:hypothetical protein n=1 Tax=Synechococcus sp. RS9916 TaxID=221359 RepID=UPI0000E53DA4|nr:hypothetical protein [Synechococcus sp. RS9916]EAU73046.1 hypothetical protein RS9916_26084 [Synechococcus sp. RS9916]
MGPSPRDESHLQAGGNQGNGKGPHPERDEIGSASDWLSSAYQQLLFGLCRWMATHSRPRAKSCNTP